MVIKKQYIKIFTSEAKHVNQQDEERIQGLIVLLMQVTSQDYIFNRFVNVTNIIKSNFQKYYLWCQVQGETTLIGNPFTYGSYHSKVLSISYLLF